MDDKKIGGLLLLLTIVCAGAGFWFGWVFSHSYCDRLWRDTLIEKKVGEYYLDDENRKKFRVITKKD